MSRILFITWDGPQTSYLEGLFLPIFKKLSAERHQFHVLQFSWGGAEHSAKTQAVCEREGVPYRSVPVWRSLGALGPFSAAVLGRNHIQRAVRDWGIDTLMPRSLMPALAVLALGDLGQLRIVFDADGFAADERVDFAGLSPNSMTYRILRWVEARTVRNADRVLVRTPKAIEILLERAGAGGDPSKFYVVGNGRDPAPFLTNHSVLPERPFRLCYAGSLGVQYCPQEMIETALLLKINMPDLIFRIFTGDGSALDGVLDRARVGNRGWIEVTRLPPDEVPAALMGCDLALALRKPAFSTQGVAPIKIGEYMLAGLPIIGTPGVGPVEELIREGVFLPVTDDLSPVWPWVRDKVLPKRLALRTRAKALGLARFSLDSAVRSYAEALF